MLDQGQTMHFQMGTNCLFVTDPEIWSIVDIFIVLRIDDLL